MSAFEMESSEGMQSNDSFIPQRRYLFSRGMSLPFGGMGIDFKYA